jgi:hypothetical protein
MVWRLLLTTALLAVPAAAREGDEFIPMTAEEVVRLHVSGESAEAIVAEIERRRPDFDLSPEMLVELRRTGLPASVMDAMIERQKDLDPAELPERESPRTVPLTIRFDPTTISVRGRINPQMAAELELGTAPEDRYFAGLAIYLVCLTADHVPDQWRSHTPLSDDELMPIQRHRLLALLATPARAEGENTGGRARLRVPATIEVAIEPGVEHDLMLGLALHIGGQYYRWRHDRWDDVVVEEQGLELPAIVKGRGFGGPNRLKLRFDRPRRHDDETPSPLHSSRNETSLLTPGSSIVTP